MLEITTCHLTGSSINSTRRWSLKVSIRKSVPPALQLCSSAALTLGELAQGQLTKDRVKPSSLRATGFRMEVTLNESKLRDAMNNPSDRRKVEVGGNKDVDCNTRVYAANLRCWREQRWMD